MPGVRALAVAFLGIGAVFGGMQVSLAAFTQEIGRPGLNGVLYGVFAAGNMLSGVVCGAVAWRREPARAGCWRRTRRWRWRARRCGPAARCCCWSRSGCWPGCASRPTLVTGYALVDALVPAATRTEAFTWLTGAVALGQAVAVTAAGLLADLSGSAAGFTVPLAGTALALAVLVALRGQLVPRSRGVAAAGVIGHRAPVAVD